MKTFIKIIVIIILGTTISNGVYAGNEQRAGQAGASELLINPWARSTGWGGANIACVNGLEAQYLNVAGTAFTEGTQLVFVHTDLFNGADISINSFGFSQKVGESGVMTIGVMAYDFGEIEKTTVFQPEGTNSTFHPQYTNIAISYAKEFSNSIYGGLTVKIISESISDLNASGVAFDAGIQYVTGKQKQLKFGIAMKNVGPTMKFDGDGLSFRGTPPHDIVMTIEQRSQDYELPSLIKIGASYDFTFGIEQKLIAAANFTSNSFTRDQYHFGLEYDFKKLFAVRLGYVYEDDSEDIYGAPITNGISGGTSIYIPLNKEKGTSLSFDYSYRDTDPFNGVHTYGVTVTL